MRGIHIHAFHCFANDVGKLNFSNIVVSIGESTLQVHLIHFDGHGTVEHLARERERGLIHIHRTHHNKVLRNGDTLA